MLRLRKRTLPFAISRFCRLPGQVVQLMLITVLAAIVKPVRHGPITLIAVGEDRLQLTGMAASALDLIRREDPRRFRRVQTFIRHIFLADWKTAGCYYATGGVCVLKRPSSPEYKKNPAANHICAYILIHEATHGLLESKRFPYTKANRRRIERICHAEAARFLSRFSYLSIREVFGILRKEIGWIEGAASAS